MKTIKLSYTILDAWAQGRWEDAVGMYLDKDLPATPSMELGKLKHLEWENHIQKSSELPDELGGGLLRGPITEQKYRKILPFSDDYQILISGKPDVTHGDGGSHIDEFKVGRTEANGYIESMQLAYYKWLVPDLAVGTYRCFNPYFNKLTVGVRFLTDRDAEQAIEHMITYGGEMIDYLATQRLIRDFKEEPAHAR